MKDFKSVAGVVAVLALGAPTALAVAAPGPHGPGSTPSNAKAYGKYCQNQSKKHVAGTPGTPFSKCVTAMAKVAHGTNPTTACKTLSKRHVAGQTGTPYSRCVSGGAKLLNDQAASHS